MGSNSLWMCVCLWMCTYRWMCVYLCMFVYLYIRAEVSPQYECQYYLYRNVGELKYKCVYKYECQYYLYRNVGELTMNVCIPIHTWTFHECVYNKKNVCIPIHTCRYAFTLLSMNVCMCVLCLRMSVSSIQKCGQTLYECVYIYTYMKICLQPAPFVRGGRNKKKKEKKKAYPIENWRWKWRIHC